MKAVKIRCMDEFGRFAIPREMRNLLGWDCNTPLEALMCKDGVFIREYDIVKKDGETDGEQEGIQGI